MPISAANAQAESEAEGRLARRRSSRLSRRPPRESRFAEAAPCHQLLRKLDRRVRQVQPRSKLLCRQRWPSVFHQRRRRRVRAPSRQDRVRTKSGSDASLQMGQHRARQHQGRHHRDLPCHQQQACSALPRRIRIPLQPMIRSGRHDPAPHLGRRPNHPYALSAPEIG